jgi:AAA+ ATPase superfamily predicted ATPase
MSGFGGCRKFKRVQKIYQTTIKEYYFMNHHHLPKYAVRPIVPEAAYTNRKEHLNYLYQAALNAIERRSMSVVLLGRRRMGKTEIFKRVVNRLFFEQEHHADIHRSVVPVYYSFKDTVSDRWDFSIDYVENFIRWYIAFRLRDSTILSTTDVTQERLIEFLRNHLDQFKELEGALNFYEGFLKKNVTMPEDKALSLPRRVSDWHEATIVMFLDEFQNTRLPQYNFDVVGLMQEAVESPTCPHFVTGSAMSILAKEILGRGSLYGRFRSRPIESMTEYWGAELALNAARHYKAEISETMAPVVAERCGGNPFYITAVIQQSVELNKPLSDETVLNEILAVDLSSGFIWGELNDQVSKWIARINEYNITKWVLYLSAMEEGDRIDLDRIHRQLLEKEGKDVPIEVIRDVLIKLSRGDLLDYMELGGWFRKVQDPILLEFLKVWGKIEVEGFDLKDIQNSLIRRYQKIQRRISDHSGYIGEIYMAQILWNAQNKTLPGIFFNVNDDISIPWHFSYIRHRVRLGGAVNMEIDVYAAAGSEVWIAESKWWTDRKVGLHEIDILLKKAERVTEDIGDELKTLRIWLFAHNGFTEEAEEFMKEKGILWSSRKELNDLLDYVGLRRLPEI